jgi:hypothetical protein
VRKWIIFHGKCIFAIVAVLAILSPWGIYEVIEFKQNYTDLHRRVNELERICQKMKTSIDQFLTTVP